MWRYSSGHLINLSRPFSFSFQSVVCFIQMCVHLLLSCFSATLLNLIIIIFWQDGHDGDNTKQSTADMTVFVSFLAKTTLISLIDVKQTNLTLLHSLTISKVSCHLNLFTTELLKCDFLESWNQYFFFFPMEYYSIVWSFPEKIIIMTRNMAL